MTDTTTPVPEFQAAGNGRRLQMWRPPMSGPNSAGNVGTVVARQRDLVRNNPWAGAAIEKSVANAIGTGVQAKAVNGSPEWKASEKRAWKRFCRELDADGVLQFDAMTALAYREWKEAGEVFARLRPRRVEDGLLVPLQVQMMESEQCPRDYYGSASNGNAIRAGIEFDKIGRRVAYWMYRVHPGDRNDGLWGADLVRIPADQVLHLYRPLRAGQLRGVPDMASVLTRAFNMERLDDNVMERQKIANLFAGFYVRAPGATGESILGETSTETDTDDTPIAGLEPGTMQELPEGVEPKFSEPPGAGTDYAEFVRSNLMAIAARSGVPYEVLTGDLRGVSDRALRLILAEFRRLIESDRWLYLLPKWCQAVRDAYFDAAVLAGVIDAPGYAQDRDMYTETLWVPDGWAYSHPVQDVDADIKAIRAGLTSRTAVVLANGDDPEEVDAQQVEDNERADTAKLKHDSDGRQAKGGNTNAAPPQGATDEK
jgi:lambda family phage portal protein